MGEGDTPDDLRSLQERLNRARRDRRGPAAGDGQDDDAFRRAVGLGFRIGLELVVAVGFGLGIGWAIDQALGSRPWAMVACLFLGFAAGVLNVFRAAKGMGPGFGFGEAPPPKPGRAEDEED